MLSVNRLFELTNRLNKPYVGVSVDRVGNKNYNLYKKTNMLRKLGTTKAGSNYTILHNLRNDNFR